MPDPQRASSTRDRAATLLILATSAACLVLAIRRLSAAEVGDGPWTFWMAVSVALIFNAFRLLRKFRGG